ncbi:hypothetical protein O3P69_016746 [Scylla paramamosain]|uniref:Uncharacterized protein n=1 Tax=Scylla paramamosain TaxID=85552 RepID=A0AAW0SZB7_SCYPA
MQRAACSVPVAAMSRQPKSADARYLDWRVAGEKYENNQEVSVWMSAGGGGSDGHECVKKLENILVN